jgi:anthranilate synthase component 1
MKYKVKSIATKILADTITPVSIYLKVRDRYANSILLESSDYHGSENSLSYICFDPISEFRVQNDRIDITFPDTSKTSVEADSVVPAFKTYLASFDAAPLKVPFIHSGFFGFTSYQAVRHFETIDIGNKTDAIPEMYYHMYRFIVVLDHFKNECHIIQNLVGHDQDRLSEVEQLITQRNFASFPFRKLGEVISNMTDHDFEEMVKKGMHHCHIGDVFQIVLSRKFSQAFKGDEFEVYRRLRSINPSPYAFYFDMGDFKLFGSSPEAQLVVGKGKATIHPIAGTFRRSGDDEKDAEIAKALLDDQKENSEHVMLVDLARNDLSKYCDDVKVERFKEVQYFSHVVHLVSNVTGTIRTGHHGWDVFASTFPAGTLSGAPKIKAMQLIDDIETDARGYYGGAIGFVDFEGNSNHAITIRTFMSQENTLHFQAGAGVVAESKPDSERKEVVNKTAALVEALKQAESI